MSLHLAANNVEFDRACDAIRENDLSAFRSALEKLKNSRACYAHLFFRSVEGNRLAFMRCYVNIFGFPILGGKEAFSGMKLNPDVEQFIDDNIRGSYEERYRGIPQPPL